jgi:hypothetical protein
MNYRPLIVVDDDNKEVRDIFTLKAVKANIDLVAIATWDKTREYLEANTNVDAIVLDAKGQLNADKDASEAHLLASLSYVQSKVLPYAIYTAYTDNLPMLEQELEDGRVFTKGKHKEEEIFDFLKNEIAKTPKLKIINQFHEPFQCFGGRYLDKKYESLLLNIISVFQNQNLDDPQNLLFNPCRIILEQVFKKITDTDNTVLPFALLQFEKQKAGLLNCYKHLSGVPYYQNNEKVTPSNFLKDSGFEFISKQIDLIISVCHPGSHEIQIKYSLYTFKLVLWALFDILIWLKKFIDERK